MKNYLFFMLALFFASLNLQAQVCDSPTGVVIDRVSDSTATITADDTSATYELYVKPQGYPAPDNASSPRPGYSDLTFPFTSNELEQQFGYDIYVRTNCGATNSDWEGPYYVAPYAEVCAEPTNVTVDRISDSTATITADDTSATYELYVKPQGFPAPDNTSAPRPGYSDLTFPFTSNELEQQFGYDVYVRTNCGTENSDWVGPIYIAPYSTPCPAPVAEDIMVERTSDTTADFTGADPAYTYQGTANRAGRPLRPYPMYGMENMTMPYTKTGLIPEFDYDVWFRTECEGEEFSEWVGPFYVPTFSEPCAEPTNVTVDRISDSTATITADDTSATYDLYIKPQGFPAPDASTAPRPGFGGLTFPFTSNELEQQFGYDVYVRIDCGSSTSEWVGPIYIAPYSTPCPAPVAEDIMVERTSDTTADFTGADPAYTYQGTANRAGRPLRPYPMYGMENMTMPYTQSGLIPEFDYDVWFRTECDGGEFSEWVGPFYVPTFSAACEDVANVQITRDGNTGTITADRTDQVYDLYVVLAGNPGPAAGAAPNRNGDNDVMFPYTRNDLAPQISYDVYVRTQCDETTTTEWVGPFTSAATQTVRLTPNPADSNVRIEGMDAVSVQILNMNGGTELRTSVHNNEVNVDGLAPGQYILQATDALGNVTTTRLMKH